MSDHVWRTRDRRSRPPTDKYTEEWVTCPECQQRARVLASGRFRQHKVRSGRRWAYCFGPESDNV